MLGFLTLLLLIFIVAFYGTYYFFGVIMGRSTKIDICGESNYTPTISHITATYNEDKIIEEKLNNILNLNYPKDKLELIFVDCSNDNTLKILKKFKIGNPDLNIKILHETKRKGLPYALNLGYDNAEGELVVKSDCDILLYEDSLLYLVGCFNDDRVGGVTGVGVTDIYFERSYRQIQTRLRIAESNLHSTYLFDTFCCFRKSLLGPIDEQSLADDAEMALCIIKKGYKSLINPKARFYERCTASFSERRKQRDRRAEGHIRLLLKNLDFLFNPKFGYFGIIIFPSNFLMMVFFPWSVLIIYIFSFIMLLQLNISYSIIYICSSTLFLYSMYKIPIMGRVGSFIDCQISLIIAQLRILMRKKSFIWDKIDR